MAIDLFDESINQLNIIRNTLLGSQPGVGSINKETRDYYLKVKALGLVNIGEEKLTQFALDKENTKYYKDLSSRTQEILKSSGMVPPAKPDNSPTQFTPVNPLFKVPIPDSAQENLERIAIAEQARKNKDFFKGNNSNTFPNSAFSNKIFPEANQPVDGHDESGELFTSQTTYTVDLGNGRTGTYVKSWVKPNGQADDDTHGTPNEPYTEKLARLLEDRNKSLPSGSYKFFIEKLHGRGTDGKYYKKGPIKKGMSRFELPNRMVFPAYIQTFNDSYDLNWGDHKFIGRGESVYMYESTKRTMQLEFYLISDFSVDLLVAAAKTVQSLSKPNDKSGAPASTNGLKPDSKAGSFLKEGANIVSNPQTINTLSNKSTPKPVTNEDTLEEIRRLLSDWGTGSSPDSVYLKNDKSGFVGGKYSGTPELLWLRTTFLSQCCYAYYRKDGKMKEQPFIRLRIGDYYDVIAKIDSYNCTQDEFDLDFNPSVLGNIPMGVKVSMNLTIIHEEEPTSDYYKFYYRSDFDTPNTTKQPPQAISTTSSGDAALDNNKAGSPIFDISRLTNQGDKLAFPKDVQALQETLGTVNSSLANLSGNKGIVDSLGQKSQSFKDLKTKEKLKEAFGAALRLTSVLEQFNLLKLKDVKKNIQFGKTTKNLSDVSLANLPTKDSFKSAEIPKVPSIPNQTTPPGKLFPQFKKDK